MSSRKPLLILSPRADEDFSDILQYTAETWGEAQNLKYRSVLNKALLNIQQNPRLGVCRSSHRILIAGRHVIVYRLAEDAIYVIRILHESMDIARHV